jgi:hypothetical protein
MRYPVVAVESLSTTAKGGQAIRDCAAKSAKSTARNGFRSFRRL